MGRPRDERGAVVAITAIMVSVLVLVAAFTVDIGQQRVARRDMQALADVVAMDMSRLIDGRTAVVTSSDPEWNATLAASVNRNSTTYGDPPTVTAALGQLDEATGTFTEASGGTVPNAVQVSANTQVDFFFVTGSGGASRTAVATSEAVACFQLGSYAAAVRSGDSSVLSSVLQQIDGAFNLSAASYTGLASAHVSLSQLAAALHVATVEGLASTTVTVSTFYAALATALTQSGDTADATILQQISTHLGSLSTESVSLAGLMSVSQGDASALDATLNVLDLVAGAATLANGSNALSVPSFSASGLGLAGGTSSLSVVQAPQMGCGKITSTHARTSQATLDLTGSLSGTPIVDSVLGLASVNVTSPASQPVTVALSLAQATGTLSGITCKSSSSSTEGLTAATVSGLSTATLVVPVSVSGTITISGLGGGLVSFVIGGKATVTSTSSPNAGSATILIPPSAYDTATSSGSGSLALPTVGIRTTKTSVSATLLGVPYTLSDAKVSSILSDVTDTVVTPLVTQVNSSLLTPLGAMLGVRTGGADVFALPSPSCDSPALRG